MSELKISLVKGGIFSIPCSTVFMKHIEGNMCRTEKNLDEKVKGRLDEFYKREELKDDIKIDTNQITTESGEKFPFDYLHIINFHKNDLPFRNISVHRYAQRFFNFAISDPNAVKVATTIHGPGAGLDACEAMEVMLEAIACALGSHESIGNLREILFIERDEEVFERLKTRLRYLEEDKDLIRFEGEDMFLQPAASINARHLKAKIKQLNSKSLFIAMPFDKSFDDIYHKGIKKSIESLKHRAERLDHEFFTGDIVDRIKKRIALASLVVADITGNNPNVFYEVGFAHGIRKPVVLISQKKILPFDLRTHYCISYKRTQIELLKIKLGEHLKALLKNR